MDAVKQVEEFWKSSFSPLRAPLVMRVAVSSSTINDEGPGRVRKCLMNQLSAVPLGLFLMPTDILLLIASCVLDVDTRGTRLARVSRAFVSPVAEAARAATTAWWTGSSPARRPRTGPTGRPSHPIVARVKGLDVRDVVALLQPAFWLNNFLVNAIVVAWGYASIFMSPMVPWGGTEEAAETIILGPEVTCFAYHHAFWEKEEVRARIERARVVLVPLNSSKHWATLRINKQLGLGELFESKPGCTNELAVEKVMQYVLRSNTTPFQYVTHTHDTWAQDDSHSCGVFTCVILLSLLEGRRVAVRKNDLEAWRVHFAHTIKDAMMPELTIPLP